MSVAESSKDNHPFLQEDLEDGTLRNYLTFGTRRSSSVSQYGNTPVVIRRSRSSNGELTTVVEQVSALQGRGTRSNYTLLEAEEKEKETDSDDENEFQDSRFNSDESFAIKENNGKDSKLLADSSDSVQKDEEVPVISEVQSTTYPQENTSAISEQQDQDHDNKKSFSQYDPPSKSCRESAEKDAVQPLEEDKKHDNKIISKDSEEITNEGPEVLTFDDSYQETTKAHKDVSSLSSKQNLSHQVPDENYSRPTSEEKDTSQTFLQNSCEPTTITSSDELQDTVSSPEVDHEAVLREYVQQPSRRSSKSLLHGNNEATLYASETSNKKELNESFKLVELKIVEPSDSLIEHTDRGIGATNTQKTLTTSDIPHLSDDSDVVFIDAGSPSLSRTKLSCESSSGSCEEVLQGHEERTDLDKATDTPDKPTTTPQPSIPDAVSKTSETKKEEITTRRRHNSHNSFRDLPIRSPTPPRRRPQKSPRTPKLREKTRQRHSSLALTSDEETQELLANGTRSASPTSKTGDFRFFSFSLKKEKSKSATSLGSKRNRERVRLTSVKLSLEDPGAVNPKLVPSQMEEDNSGKRVGVRNMVIDGTIKRNFIVIHPSDESDTIGLAPMSPQGAQKDLTPASTPEALSTVKTRIAAPSSEKLEVMKRISCQGGLKEELSDIPENLKAESKGTFRGSLNVSQISKSLRIKQNKKNMEHLSLRTSHSLSSEPVCPSPSSSQILYKSPSSLSKVDCDSPNVSAQKVHCAEDSGTVSKLCVVM